MKHLKEVNIPLVFFILFSLKFLAFGIDGVGILILGGLYGFTLFLKNKERDLLDEQLRVELNKIKIELENIDNLKQRLDNVQGSINAVRVTQGLKASHHEFKR